MVEAKKNGFFTEMVYIGTESVEINMARVKARSMKGEHSASVSTVRDVYEKSLNNLLAAIKVADKLRLIDNTAFIENDSEIEPFAVIERMIVTRRLEFYSQVGHECHQLSGGSSAGERGEDQKGARRPGRTARLVWD